MLLLQLLLIWVFLPLKHILLYIKWFIKASILPTPLTIKKREPTQTYVHGSPLNYPASTLNILVKTVLSAGTALPMGIGMIPQLEFIMIFRNIRVLNIEGISHHIIGGNRHLHIMANTASEPYLLSIQPILH